MNRLLRLTYKLFGNHLSGEGIEMMELVTKAAQERAELRQQLAEAQKLSEERRMALKICQPYALIGHPEAVGRFCRKYMEEDHRPNCNFARLIKKED